MDLYYIYNHMNYLLFDDVIQTGFPTYVKVFVP